MKRLFVIALVLALGLMVGCEPQVEVDSPEAGKGVSSDQDSSEAGPAPSEAISTDGPGEAAALAAAPAGLEMAEKLSSIVWPDLTGAEPALTAYLVAADMGGQSALFEVRADGVAHGLYAYQKAFDAGTLLWGPTDQSGTWRATPQSDRERAAVSAVEAAMRDSFPDASFAVAIYGYRFEYVKDGTVRMVLEIAPDGSVISSGL